MGYRLKGRLLEVCTCNTLCPCWVGDDPDGGTCDSAIAYHFDVALAGVMALEKNMPWGRRISAPLGVVLLISGVAIGLL